MNFKISLCGMFQLLCYTWPSFSALKIHVLAFFMYYSTIVVLNYIRSLSIPVTIHAGFSRSGILPPSVGAAFKDHQDALKAFNNELTSCGIAPGDISSHMTSLSEQQLTGVAAGSKRKRPPV